jgi:release factor glutamine methyltransferase
MDVRTALQQGQTLLEEARLAAPRLTAEVLLMHAIGCERSWLYAHSGDELREVSWIHYGRYLHERLQGKPTQYITGRQEFYGRQFRVTPDVLIPRPETEHVVEAALARANAARTIVDVGTGSGAIAITLALETKARVFAADISVAALRVASENARALGAKIDFVACDLTSAFTAGAFDMVVSNPPYVPALDQTTIQREVRDYEPPVALYGGDDGLDFYRRLVPEAWRLLEPGGWLMMELGYALVDAVRAMLADWRDVEIAADLAGLPRVVLARRR